MLCFFVFQKEGGTEKMKITIQNGELEQKVGKRQIKQCIEK